MSIWRDPYAILGVSMEDDDAGIRQAYRKLAAKHHPDRHRGDKTAQDKFADINWAYQQVKDEPARAIWQTKAQKRFGTSQMQNPGEAAQPSNSLPERGEDVEISLDVTFLEAFHGTHKTLDVSSRKICPDCGGSGAAPGHSSHACPDCRGTGSHRLGESLTVTCARCNGFGAIVKVPCPRCERGIATIRRNIEIEIPVGIRSGTILRVKAEGEPGWKSPGDILVKVFVGSHPFFERKEQDLGIIVPVHYGEAVLGSSVKIPAPEGGEQMLKIPPGTRSGMRLRVPGAGFPHYRDQNRRGDLYAEVQVVAPKSLDPAFRRLVVQLQAFETEDPRQHFWG